MSGRTVVGTRDETELCGMCGHWDPQECSDCFCVCSECGCNSNPTTRIYLPWDAGTQLRFKGLCSM